MADGDFTGTSPKLPRHYAAEVRQAQQALYTQVVENRGLEAENRRVWKLVCTAHPHRKSWSPWFIKRTVRAAALKRMTRA